MTSNNMIPYKPEVGSSSSRSIIPSNASKVHVSPNNHMANNFPPLDYVQQALMRQQQHQNPVNDKYSMITNGGAADPNPVRKSSSALPAIMPPNHGAVQPYQNGYHTNDESSDAENDADEPKLELEYHDTKSNDKIAAIEDKSRNEKNNHVVPPTTTTTTTTNNGVIKVAMVADISMSNFHQCK